VDETAALFILGGFGGVAIAVGIAILRYRLYDIEIVINRALVFSVLAVFVTAVYAAIVLVPVFVLGSEAGSNLVLTIGATALVGVAFRPAYRRARELANRFVYGKRTTPYEALTGLSGARSLDELLPLVARYAAESTTARRAIAWMSTGVELRPAASWPEEGSLPPPVPLGEEESPTLPGDHTYSLIHGGDLLGAATIVMGPGETLPREDHRLLSDLAAHSAIALRGVLEAVELPTGIVTFLMTDVQGSTRLWEEEPGAMATALREHDALVRETVRDHEGVLIKWRGEGDSTFSVFEDPEKAVEAAAAIQRAISGRSWKTPRPLRIRAALHTGKAELRERDYFGPVVNRCARLRSIAEGGQTVVSRTTASLVADGLPASVKLVDLGAQQLKDLPEPEQVYELTLS
jgi:class 3 adenylate cyclase